MAESVRTRPASFQLRVPEITSATAQATAQGLNQLENSLSRMNSFFLQQAKQKAERDGLEYGAENAPTIEQLQAAEQSGEEILLPGGDDTVFDRAARRAAIQITSDNLELAAKEQINAIVLAGENSGANPASVEADINAVIHGFGATFDETSPVLARQFRARLGVFGNAKYSSYHSSYITKSQAQAKANWQASLLLTLDSIPDMMKYGVVERDADGKFVAEVALTSETLKATKKIILNEAIAYNYKASEIKVLEKTFDDAVVNGAKQLIGNAVLNSQTPHEIYTQIRNKSDLLPDNVKNALGLLSDPNDQSAVIEMARTAWMQTVNDSITIQERAIRENEALKKGYELSANQALMNYKDDPDAAITAFKTAIASMKNVDAGRARELEEMLVKIEGREPFALTSNQTTIFAIDSKINDFDLTLTLADLNQHLLNNELSYEDWKAYSTTVRTRMDTNFAEALTETRKRLQLPTGMVADRSVLETWEWNTLNKIELAMRKARRDSEDEGQSFNAIDWLDENFDAMARPEQDSWVDAALNDLTGYTRSSLTRQINAATNEDVKASLLRLLELADRLEDEGLLPAEFNQ